MPVVPFIPAIIAGAGAIYAGNKAGKATDRATDAATAGQESSLAYQMEREALPLGFRDAAMETLGGEYGLTLDEEGNILSDGSSILDRAKASPMYTGMLEAGESAIGRSASATGRLRGGATPAKLGGNAQKALMVAYQQQMQGLSGLAGAPLNTGAIASNMANIGSIRGQGIAAQGRIDQQTMLGVTGAIGSGINTYLSNKV